MISSRKRATPVWLALICLVALAYPAEAAPSKPNFLIIMADDLTHNDLPVYGGVNARTPNIDKLADEGLVFRNAYLSEAMCQPCRAELYSGQYPMRNGCAWNHSASRPNVKSMPHYLRTLGYRVGLAGKVHVKPDQAFPFESIGGFDPNCVRDPTRAHELTGIEDFFSRDDDEPFCLVVALVEPHVPWVMGDASQYPPDKIQLPPNIADNPRTREAFSRYLAEITYMDGQVGDILKSLADAGQAENTLTLFTSEQGAQFPGCKWTNWDTGLHTALIARWPGNVAPGTQTDGLVQYADVLPTLIDAAGGAWRFEPFDGHSVLPTLVGEADDTGRNYAYGIHNNLPEGPMYPIRTISDGTYRLIVNLQPDRLYIEKHLMGIQGSGRLNNPYWGEWIGTAWNTPHTYDLVQRYVSRPAVEFYHTAKDPYELNNLADDSDPELGMIRKRLQSELDRWMNAQQDPGAPVDTDEALKAARRGNHLYGLNP